MRTKENECYTCKYMEKIKRSVLVCCKMPDPYMKGDFLRPGDYPTQFNPVLKTVKCHNYMEAK